MPSGAASHSCSKFDEALVLLAGKSSKRQPLGNGCELATAPDAIRSKSGFKDTTHCRNQRRAAGQKYAIDVVWIDAAFFEQAVYTFLNPIDMFLNPAFQTNDAGHCAESLSRHH